MLTSSSPDVRLAGERFTDTRPRKMLRETYVNLFNIERIMNQVHRVLLLVAGANICLGAACVYSQDSRMEEIAYRSLANQASFATYVCKFSFEAGIAQSREQLIAGELSTLHGNANGWWAKRREKELFTVDVGDTFVSTPTGNGRFNVPFSGGEKYIDNGDVRVAFSDELGVANLGTQEKMANRITRLSPWNSLGRFFTGEAAVPAESLLDNVGLPSPFGNTIEEDEDKVRVITDLGETRLLHEFSTTMNYLPTHVAFLGDQASTHIETVEAIEVDGVGWFPKTVIAYEIESNASELKHCYRFSVDDFAYREPSDAELTFESAGEYQLHGPAVVVGNQIARVASGVSLGPDTVGELEQALLSGTTLGRGVASAGTTSGTTSFFFLAVAATGSVLVCLIGLMRRKGFTAMEPSKEPDENVS